MPDTNEWLPSDCAEDDLYDPWTMISLTIPLGQALAESDASSILNESFGKRKFVAENDDNVTKKKMTKISTTISEKIMMNLENQPYVVGYRKFAGYNLTMVQYIESELNSK